jgi:hypothetical protein
MKLATQLGHIAGIAIGACVATLLTLIPVFLFGYIVGLTVRALTLGYQLGIGR